MFRACLTGAGARGCFVEFIEHYRQRLNSGDLLKAYRALVDALQLAAAEHLPTAFQLLIGIDLLEESGLDRKLGYASDPPQERALALRAQIFQRLSERVSSTPRSRRLGRHFAHAVIDASLKLDDAVQQRIQRGSQKARDADVLTESATLRARALVRLGQFETARRVLEAFRTKAERGTLRDDLIAMRCLFEFARISELLGDVDGACNVYLAVVRLGIPNF